MANLLRHEEKVFSVEVMNVHKQTGVVDCALYAMAVATCCLASKSDPTSIIFKQADLKSHYCQCMETRKVADFPVRKKRRPV